MKIKKILTPIFFTEEEMLNHTPSDLISLLVNSDELSGFVNSSVETISYKLNNKMFSSSRTCIAVFCSRLLFKTHILTYQFYLPVPFVQFIFGWG